MNIEDIDDMPNGPEKRELELRLVAEAAHQMLGVNHLGLMLGEAFHFAAAGSVGVPGQIDRLVGIMDAVIEAVEKSDAAHRGHADDMKEAVLTILRAMRKEAAAAGSIGSRDGVFYQAQGGRA